MENLLAIDAGGTSTRAVFLAPSGECLGYGVSGGGNPVSRGFEGAASAVLDASLKALGAGRTPVHSLTVALAGASLDLPPDLFLERLGQLNVLHGLMIESDLLATFYAGSYHDDGYALIAGTGAVAARVKDGQLAAVADGTGWLLGDSGAGFWLGREAVRAVAAALDGRGPRTALTNGVLDQLEIRADPAIRKLGRTGTLQELITKVYGLAPIELSRLAPLVFEASGDLVAREIVGRAAAALATTLLTVMEGGPEGPLVFGGSVLTRAGTVAAAVMEEVSLRTTATHPTPVMVHDGLAGAAVLALKRHDIAVDAGVFARIQSTLAALRG